MKNFFFLISICLLSVSCINAQWGNGERVKGNGEMSTDIRTTDSYDEIKLVGSMNVQLVAGNEGKIKVEAESNLQEFIITEVKGGSLKIYTAEGYNLSPREEILITVPFKDLNAISVTGSGDIWTRDKITGSDLQVQVTGSGNMKLELDVNQLDGKITGSGDIQLKGNSNKFECTVTGSGDFDAYDLQAEDVDAKVSGSGDIMIYAKNSLKASVFGSGDIVYKGDPEKQDFNSSGSGGVSSY
ncbi:head GIN domain-containing protein [Christiangramia sabulilitoris]|uniref:DUF2807 domain-containing protein n=1 Tax=Christiangramia sabulilitoris TaxID=2583991 RepID=A0A550HX92_9FLAO|nr:head GIN domain-containing protein [Christiangramia sabulilitoris]TRO63285.1 DUF2807 domain-containing protein [Christiangramia sabulilitoris]